MNDQRFLNVAPEAYAALGSVLAELGGENARLLEAQARHANVVKDLPGRMLDLDVAAGSDRCDCPDGPLPVRALVVREGGQLVGELLVWVKNGWLVGLEQAWFTDEPPARWPLAEELNFQQ